MIRTPRFSIGDCIVTKDNVRSAVIVDRRYGGHQYDRDWYYVISPNDQKKRPYELSQYDILFQNFDILCSTDIDNTDTGKTMGNVDNENTDIHRRQ